MSSVKGIIFDLGNTLMYLDGEWESVRLQGAQDLVRFLTAHGLEIDPHRFGEQYLSARRSLYARAVEDQVEYTAEYSLRASLAEHGHEDVGAELIEGALRSFFAFEEERWKAYPNAQTTLRQLSDSGYRLALISNATDDRLIQRLVDRLDFRRWFDMALTSAGVGLRKPHPGIFQEVLTQWGFPPSQVVMVGDTLGFDVLGARNSGLKGVLAAWDLYHDYDAGGDHVVPDATASSLSDLPGVIASLSQQSSTVTK
jgi:HAD superfamily hydrolase (TIGR01662 family)